MSNIIGKLEYSDIESLKNFDKLPYDRKKAIMEKVPVKMRGWLYAKYLNDSQVEAVFIEWLEHDRKEDAGKILKAVRKQRRFYLHDRLLKLYTEKFK